MMTASEAIAAIQRHRLSVDYSAMGGGYYCCWRVRSSESADGYEVMGEVLMQGPYRDTVIAAVQAAVEMMEVQP